MALTILLWNSTGTAYVIREGGPSRTTHSCHLKRVKWESRREDTGQVVPPATVRGGQERERDRGHRTVQGTQDSAGDAGQCRGQKDSAQRQCIVDTVHC